MKQKRFRIWNYAAVFVVTLSVLWLLLFLSALIPNSAIRSNMEQSTLSYKQRDAFEFTREAQLNSVADHYADSIWLNVAWNMGTGEALTASIQTNYYDGEELGKNAGLYYTVMEGVQPNTDYTRYWHGTAAFIRVLHLFTDVEGVKLIGFIVFLLLVALSVALLARRKHPDLAVLLLLSLAAVRVWNIRLSMEYQPAFLVAFGILPLYLLLERRGDKPLISLSIIGGAAVAFFDFLTTETVTILLPLMLVVAVRAKEGRLGTFRETLPVMFKSCAAWGISYVGTFLVKWTLASIVTGTNAFAAALSSVGERVGGTIVNFAEQPDSFLSAPLANLTMLFGGSARVDYGRMLVGGAVFLLILLSVWYLLHGKEKQPATAVLPLCLGAVVLVRCLVLNNHSYLHCFFTHRALVSLVFALLAATRLNISLPKKGRRK